MNMSRIASACIALTMTTVSMAAHAQPSTSTPDTRYGLFNWLDHRSQYGQGAFPEPFLVDESDLETGELRLDWLHQEKRGHIADEVTTEIEKSFGLFTLEVEIHYERDQARSFNPITLRNETEREEGLGNIDLGARYPIHQFVSADGLIDNTVGVGFEIGIPSNTRISQNTEIVPKIFDDLRIGEHFTLQAIVGYAMLKGPGEHEEALEYGFDFGYTFSRRDLQLPGIESITPMFEIAGEIATHGEDSGHSNIVGNAAVRINLKTFHGLQPRLGIGYVFPLNSEAREDFRWGIVTSLVFEF